MKRVELDKVSEAVEGMFVECTHKLGGDVLSAIKRAKEREEKAGNAGAAAVLGELVQNAEIAEAEQVPLCQDTGLAVVFVERGVGIELVASSGSGDESSGLFKAINAGVERAYEKGYLRKSVVAEPMERRENTGTNTPAVIHYNEVEGDELRISVMAKGGGCENKSQFRMFNPTDPAEAVEEWVGSVAAEAGPNACPPFVIGVGIGGDFEQSAILSKKSLLRGIDERHGESYYAAMEVRILERVNSLGIGPMGLGGDTTALAVHIETGPSHIASLAVSVNIECHSHRHRTVVL